MNLDESHLKIIDFAWGIALALGGIIWRMLLEKIKGAKTDAASALAALKAEYDKQISALKRDHEEADRRLSEEIIRQRTISSKIFDELRDVRKEGNAARVDDLKWAVDHGFAVRTAITYQPNPDKEKS